MTDPTIRMPIPDDDQAARSRQFYQRGPTTVFACRHDTRFSYCLHVPGSFDQSPGEHRLIVAVHGSSRTMTELRDGFAAFAEAHHCVVLAPLFPVGVAGDDNGEGFKYLIEGGTRYDLVLLHMIEEAGARLGSPLGAFFLFGFSGGAQFVNRFLLLHPAQLWGVSIAAPGSVTLLDDSRDYWVGTRNLRALFGVAADRAAMGAVPVQLVVGGADDETWEINYKPGRAGYMEGINDTGRTRIERSRALHENLTACGVASRLDVVPGAGHDWRPLMPATQDFCRELLTALRARAGR
jgi:poly(3-hydroxybutyrate) depolymerase